MHCFKISSYNAKERIKRQITAIRNTTSCHKSKYPGPAIQKLQDPRSSKVPSVRVRVYKVNPSFTPSLLFLSLISIIWNSMKRYVLCYVPQLAQTHRCGIFEKLVLALVHSNCREIRARTLRFRGASSQNDITYIICVTRPMLLRTRL